MTAAQNESSVHFEIQGLRGKSWTIIEIAHDESRARASGEEAWKNGGFHAVRVIRERYNARENTYRSMEIFNKGKVPKLSAADEDAVPAGVCWKPGDLYSYEGQLNISKFLASFLDRMELSPMELLHCPEHYYKLDNSGTELQNAVQRSAVRQVKESGQSVQERVKQLYSIIEKAAEELKRDWEKFGKDRIRNDDPAALIAALQESDIRSYRLTLALVRRLGKCKNRVEKFALVLQYLDPDAPEWILRVYDKFFADFINAGPVLKKIYGEGRSLGDRVLILADLLQGSLEHSALKAESDAGKLAFCLKEGRLPASSQALIKRIVGELKGTKRLTDGGLLEEFTRQHDILAALRGKENHSLVDERILTAAKERCARLLNGHAVGEYLGDCENPAEKARMLLDLSDVIVGEQNQQKLSGMLRPCMMSPDNRSYYRGVNANFLERMREVTRLQSRFYRSGLEETNIERYCKYLDDCCYFMMEKGNLLARIARGSQEPHQAGYKLLQLLASGYFTVGRAQSTARKQVRQYMKADDFIEKTIAAPTEKEQQEKLSELQKLMADAGMVNQD